MILPMFFALSGFLVCGSLDRTRRLTPFIVHRVLRIVPALAVEIALSALILGPFMTQFPLPRFFTEPAFGRYFLNIAGIIHFQLPGLFSATPERYTVNASLWTIPYELECYIALVALSITGMLKNVRLLSALVLASWVFFTARYVYQGSIMDAMQSGPPGRLLVICFIAGNVIYLMRERVRTSITLTFAAGLISFALLSRPETSFLAPFPVAYFTASLGLTRPPKIPVLMDGDYSYGLYLFAFPIQQTFSALFPESRTWLSDVLVALVLGLGYAFLSWHLVEKPVLDQRKRITAKVDAVAPMIGSIRLRRVSADETP
jgi:peptidoglycan/LPS O-acetylase OafA/YrhL